MIYYFCFALFMIGVYGIVIKRNIIKQIIGVIISTYAVQLFIMFSGYHWQGSVPDDPAHTVVVSAVDPVAQMMVLFSIILNCALMAVMTAVAMRLYRRYRTFDRTQMRAPR